MSDLVQRRKVVVDEMMRNAICDAAATVLAESGFAAFTMDRVAEAAGVSKGTLYNYFQDKDALEMAVIEMTFAPLAAEVDRAFAESADLAGILGKVIRIILMEVEKRRALGLVLCGQELPLAVAADLRQRQVQFGEKFTALIQRAAEAGLLRFPHARPADLGRLLRLTIHGIIHERIRNGADSPAVEKEASDIECFLIRSWFKE